MDAGWQDVCGDLGRRALEWYRNLADETGERGLLALIAPVDPYNRYDLFTPLVVVAGAVGVVLLAGTVVAASVTAAAALLALIFILSEVFGYELELEAQHKRHR